MKSTVTKVREFISGHPIIFSFVEYHVFINMLIKNAKSTGLAEQELGLFTIPLIVGLISMFLLFNYFNRHILGLEE